MTIKNILPYAVYLFESSLPSSELCKPALNSIKAMTYRVNKRKIILVKFKAK